MTQPIQLNRRFREVKPVTPNRSEPDAETAPSPVAPRSSLAWEDVLLTECAVILGEAGTGKTTEFRQRCELLRQQGQHAFFCRIEDLIAEGMPAALPPSEASSFDSWSHTSMIGHFFLDAADEARLRGQSLGRALRILGAALLPHMSRVRVLISCRASDWRSQSDLQEIRRTLLSNRNDARVFSLVELDDSQVFALANLQCDDSAAFIGAARRAHAHVFLERPRDVAWLVSYWMRNSSIGSLTDLIENDIEEKLQERNRDRKRSILTNKRARAAAAALAGLATIQQKTFFALPDGDLDVDRMADSLAPQTLLPDLLDEEVSELLTRPLFDEATYGRVQIHHRSVTEFLAARWVLDLLHGGLALSEVYALLFRDTSDGLAIPAGFRPMAGWLAGFDERIRARIFDTEPIVLIEAGDPSVLPDSLKCELLRKLAGQYGPRQRFGRNLDATALARFASVGIVAVLVELLLIPEQADELLEMLLTIVRAGQLVDCVDAVSELALDLRRSGAARAEAIRIAAELGDGAQRSSLRARLVAGQTIDTEIAGMVVERLLPEPLEVQLILEMLGKVDDAKGESFRLEYALGHGVYTKIPVPARAAFVRGLIELVGYKNGSSSGREWLLVPLSRVVVEHASAADDSDSALLEALVLFDTLSPMVSYSQTSAQEEVRTLLATRPDFRRLLLWQRAARLLLSQRRYPRTYYDVIHSGDNDRLWQLTISDAGWLEADCVNAGTARERLLAFSCLRAVGPSDESVDGGKEWARRIALLAMQFSETRARLEREHRKPKYVSPSEPRWARLRKMHENRRKRQASEDMKLLHVQLDDLRTGEALGTLFNLWRAAEGDNIDALVATLTKRFDSDVARAAVAGWVRVWRTVKSPLAHEEEQNKISLSVLVGLTGIEAELQLGLEVARLSAPEATQAARLASRSMNGFPPWVDVLCEHHADVAGAVFGECIRYEFAAASSPHLLVLANQATSCVKTTCDKALSELLDSRDPAELDALERVLGLALSMPLTRDVLRRIAQERCQASVLDRDRHALWTAAWLAVAPEAAADHLQAVLGGSPADSMSYIETFAARVWSWMESEYVEYPLPDNAALLARLLVVVLASVRPVDDRRGTGVRVIGVRDHAESLRNLLLDRLAKARDGSVYDVLRKLAADARWVEWSDWLNTLAERRRRDDLAAPASNVTAQKLLRLFMRHGLESVEHLERENLTTVRSVNVEFAIVVALPEEFAALRAEFPDSAPLESEPGDTHTFYTASVQTTRSDGTVYRLVLCQAPKMGPMSAANTVRAVIARWRPRGVLLVGIACGLPSETAHGDIIVADQIADDTLGKVTGDGERQVRWTAYPVGAALFERAQHVPASWADAIRVPRPRPGFPVLIPGTVVSGGDVVMDDDLIRRYLSMWPKLVGIEMEAGGCASAVHDTLPAPEFLMIKAVSDHGSDKHDPDVKPWRAYAYAAAAAFARAFLASGPMAPAH